jgi:hypothetical protein
LGREASKKNEDACRNRTYMRGSMRDAGGLVEFRK